MKRVSLSTGRTTARPAAQRPATRTTNYGARSVSSKPSKFNLMKAKSTMSSTKTQNSNKIATTKTTKSNSASNGKNTSLSSMYFASALKPTATKFFPSTSIPFNSASSSSIFLSLRAQSSQPQNTQASSPMQEKIAQDIKANRVVLYMKGVPEQPQCGFSRTVVHVLNTLGVDFVGHNVLASEELRNEIKKFTNWPTIPQVFIDGEFVGGCDILVNMYKSGELPEMLIKKGLMKEPEANDQSQPQQAK